MFSLLTSTSLRVNIKDEKFHHQVRRLSYSAIKTVQYPKEYYEKHQARINRVIENHHDKKSTKLPSKVRFKREES